jgi:hypothetical protein
MSFLSKWRLFRPQKFSRISWNLAIPYKIPLGLAAFINIDINEERFYEKLYTAFINTTHKDYRHPE